MFLYSVHCFLHHFVALYGIENVRLKWLLGRRWNMIICTQVVWYPLSHRLLHWRTLFGHNVRHSHIRVNGFLLLKMMFSESFFCTRLIAMRRQYKVTICDFLCVYACGYVYVVSLHRFCRHVELLWGLLKYLHEKKKKKPPQTVVNQRRRTNERTNEWMAHKRKLTQFCVFQVFGKWQQKNGCGEFVAFQVKSQLCSSLYSYPHEWLSAKATNKFIWWSECAVNATTYFSSQLKFYFDITQCMLWYWTMGQCPNWKCIYRWNWRKNRFGLLFFHRVKIELVCFFTPKNF